MSAKMKLFLISKVRGSNPGEGTMEDMRQLVIWSQVYAYRALRHESTVKAATEIRQIVDKYPESKADLRALIDLAKTDFANTVRGEDPEGHFIDDGTTFLTHCLLTMGKGWEDA